MDAAIPGGTYVYNTWGGHQPRITSHSDGTVRLLYLKTDANSDLYWRLMRRDTNGVWQEEASAATFDDVALMRDARTDRAHVIAWPNSVPTTYSSPTFTAAAIPGTWQSLPATARHYGNAGIASDGTVCLKASHEFSTLPLTSTTNTEYACGSMSSGSGAWTWSGVIAHSIGLRHAYDYIFPNPEGLPRGMYGTSTRDIYKTAANLPNLAGFPYAFNGTRFYATGLNSDAGWIQANTNEPISVPSDATTSPRLSLTDSFIDSKGRVLSSFFADDPADSRTKGLYMEVADASGGNLFRGRWSALPTYGHTRIFEDGKNRLWVLWSAQGVSMTYVRLYPIIETTLAGAVSFSLGEYTDLQSAFNPYSIQGGLYLATPRGGNEKQLYVDAIYNTCWTLYQTGVSYDNGVCFGSNNSERQRVFYARIRLPD